MGHQRHWPNDHNRIICFEHTYEDMVNGKDTHTHIQVTHVMEQQYVYFNQMGVIARYFHLRIFNIEMAHRMYVCVCVCTMMPTTTTTTTTTTWHYEHFRRTIDGSHL